MSDTFTCTRCGTRQPVWERTVFDGQALCTDCLREHTTTCTHCDTRLWTGDNAGTEDTPLCQQCYDDRYTSCTRCGVLLRRDDAYFEDDDDDEYDPLCQRCYSSARKCIQNYYYKPHPIFYGEGKRFFGVELEIDGAGERDNAAEHLMDIANGNHLEHLYCKHDGSLEDGFELVTHPMTLQYHMDEMPWAGVLSEAVQMGYLSHRACTCGLHVHVNRSAFGSTEKEQEDVIARILFFVENHWNEMLRFSRRSQSQMEQWAARYGRKDDPKEVLKHAKGSSMGRYTCVNLTNFDTIEFRLFRGTLKLNTFLATLQMVDRICDVALSLSDQEMQELTWTNFVIGCTAPELIQYLKERRLYVNEPVEMEVEV